MGTAPGLGWLCIPTREPSPQLLDGNLQVVQFHRRAQRPASEPECVSLLTCPGAVLHDDALAQREQLLRE